MADGKFINTEIVNELDAIVDSFKQERLPNPFYNFNTSKGTTVTYYNVDMQNYPLDTVTGMQYASVGPLTNAKYNKIEKFVLYGLEKVLVTLADTDDGTEGEEISGDAIVLPNTIHPYAGDFFTIDHAKEKVLFRVIDAQSDTFENGANVYQINYKLEHNSNELIEKFNIGTESTFLLNNVGTQYNSVIENKVYQHIGRIEETCTCMRKYYKKIFYDDRVQALIFSNSANKFYDSYLTEFVKKNGLISSRGDYLYLEHQLSLPKTFELDYDRTFFYCIEHKSSKKFKNSSRLCFGELIDNKYDVFANRAEPYLQMNYSMNLEGVPQSISPGLVFEIFDAPLLEGIANDKLFGDDILSDVIIKYFNDHDITEDDLDALDVYDYMDNAMQFYYVPIVIFILEYYIKALMGRQANI